MSLQRNIIDTLRVWGDRDDRMPLMLQGARQVGKTTVVRQLGEEYDVYMEFNLERVKDRQPFETYPDIDELVEALFLQMGIIPNEERRCLIFIDEIQEWPAAVNMLRYFYEDYPQLHVIASGSLLDFALDESERIPVGRVEYAVLHPMNFEEYLMAAGDKALLAAYQKMPISKVATTRLFEAFHKYTMIGGMPRVVDTYIRDQSVTGLKRIYNSLMKGYRDDVEKYARNKTDREVIRHIIGVAPTLADQRVKFQKFGNSEYRAREVGEAFRSLEKARLLDLIYPTTATTPPIITDYDKRPRLQFLDTGLINHAAALQSELLGIKDLNDASRGRTVQHIVYQEVKSRFESPDYHNTFWVREERRSQAEVDLLIPLDQYLIPVEIKSGAVGKLRSLHEYMDRCEHTYAVRLYRGPIRVDVAKTRLNKEYQLLSLPYFLAGRLEEYMRWFIGGGPSQP